MAAGPFLCKRPAGAEMMGCAAANRRLTVDRHPP
nr:MAG TPA: hypothetical protein [Caudoviricetes sp.]